MVSINRHRVLFISYLFPPIGGAGVQRSLKFVKYLPKFGYKPFILTVKAISYYIYDDSLLNEVPSEAHIIRTESLDPLRLNTLIFPGQRSTTPKKIVRNPYFSEGSLLVRIYRWLRNFLAFPDVNIGWIPFAYRKGLEVINKHDINVIFASIGPLSSALLAYLLSRKTKTPYMLDFRDGWIDDPYLVCPTSLHKRGHAFLEKLTVGSANAVTVYGETLSKCLIKRYPWLAECINVLPNGFDPADLKFLTPKKWPKEKYRLVYMGSLYTHHEANFRVLLDALKKLPEKIRGKIEVTFVGQFYARAKKQVSAAGLEEQVRFVGYISHSEALSYLASSDASLLFVRPGDFSSITGKVFEYLMVRRPILACIEPKGLCSEILHKAGQADWITPPDNAEKLAQNIAALAHAGWPRPEGSDWEQFSRKQHTHRLASILNRLAEEKDNMQSKCNKVGS